MVMHGFMELVQLHGVTYCNAELHTDMDCCRIYTHAVVHYYLE